MAAAAPTPWHDYLTGALGFHADTATYWETNQGYDSPASLLRLDAKKLAETMKNLRRLRTDPIDVPQAQEERFLETMYVVHGRYFSTRVTEIADLTEEARSNWGRALKTQDTYKEVTEVPDCTNFPRNWVQAFDNLEEYFNTIVGENCKIPLIYILRQNVEVKPAADDDEDQYPSKLAQMCARMPHYDLTATPVPNTRIQTKYYLEDTRKVWEKLSLIFKDTVHFTYLKPYQRAREGREAYLALRNHYLGPNMTRTLAAQAESELDKLRYTGEKRRYNFETFVNAHKRIHNVYDDLKRTGKHEGISEGTKVRKLMKGINNRHLENIRSQICTSDDLGEDFEKAVGKFRDYINQSKHLFADDKDHSASIGAVGSKPSQGGGKGINWDTSDVEVELRHYSPEEYKRLTNPQKLKLKRWRQGGHTEEELKRTMYNPNHPSMKSVVGMMRNAKISNSKRQSHQAKKAHAKPKPGNRNNKALVKQGSNARVASVKEDDDDEDME